MYGNSYSQNINPATSPPPLHHPGMYVVECFCLLLLVPVHPIPPVRSPPPSQLRTSNYNPSSYAPPPPPPPQGFSFYGQNFGQFFGVNDTTAQMGLHVMGNVVGTSQEYVEQNVLRFFNTRALKPYFNVSTSYVIRKLGLLLVPWRHKPWSRQMRRNEVNGAVEGYKPPREDINAPDLYIPGNITPSPSATALLWLLNVPFCQMCY